MRPTPSWPSIGEVGPRCPAARARSVPQMPVWVRCRRMEVGSSVGRGMVRVSKVRALVVGIC